MQKTAQKRSFRNKLKEMTNISGIAAEKYFKPELLRIMNSIRSADNDIRSIVSGKSIDGGSFYSDAESLKNLLKSAKTNLNRREYIGSITDLGRFHKKLSEINNIVATLNYNVDKIHHQFLFQDLGDKRINHLKDLHNRWAENKLNSLVKEAGIMDLFVNVGTKRGRALAAWEKKYPKVVSKLRDSSLEVLTKSSSIYENLLGILSNMASARAERNIDGFVSSAGEINKIFKKYDVEFKDYYTNIVKPFVDKAELFLSKEVPATESTELGKQDIGAEPSKDTSPTNPSPPPMTVNQPPIGTVLNITNTPQTPETTAPQAQMGAVLPVPGPASSKMGPPTPVNVSNNVPTDKEEESPNTQRSPGTPGAQLNLFNAAHQNFINSLDKMAGEDSFILSLYIKKYARSIEESDPQSAIQLFNIAKSLKE